MRSMRGVCEGMGGVCEEYGRSMGGVCEGYVRSM